MEDSESLYENANDLWYSLREDYSNFETFATDFKSYLSTAITLIQSMPNARKLDFLEPIAHNADTGRNVAYSIITAISGCRDNFPDILQSDVNTLLAAAVDAFSTPNFAEYWNDLEATIEQFIKNSLHKK